MVAEWLLNGGHIVGAVIRYEEETIENFLFTLLLTPLAAPVNNGHRIPNASPTQLKVALRP